jgi:uncharacterized protein (TIGR02145 family)
MKTDIPTINNLIKEHLKNHLNKRVNILVSVNYTTQIDLDRQLFKFYDSGFLKICVNGKLKDLENNLKIDSDENFVIEVVVDRIRLEISPECIKRYFKSIKTGLEIGENRILVVDNDTNEVILDKSIAQKDSSDKKESFNKDTLYQNIDVQWVDKEKGIIIKDEELFFFDSRDGKEYPLYVNQYSIWFAKNLAFENTEYTIDENDVLYKNIKRNKYNFVPYGWLLPTIADWNFLSSTISTSEHPLYARHGILGDEQWATPYSIVRSYGDYGLGVRINGIYQVIDVKKNNRISVFDLKNECCIVSEEGNLSGGELAYFDADNFELIQNWYPGLYSPPYKSSSVRDLSALRFDEPSLERFGIKSENSFFYIDGGHNNCLEIVKYGENRIKKVDFGLPVRCFIPLDGELLNKIFQSSYNLPFDIEEPFFEEFNVSSFVTLKRFNFIYSQYLGSNSKYCDELNRLIKINRDFPI